MSVSTTYSIRHLTTYNYANPVNLAYNEAKLTPRSFENPLLKQSCIDSSLNIQPHADDISTRQDYFGNQVTQFNFTQSHKTVEILSNSLVSRKLYFEKDKVLSYLKTELQYHTWNNAQQVIQEEPLLKLFSLSSKLIPKLDIIQSYSQASFDNSQCLYDSVFDLMNRIYTDFSFESGVTTVTTELSEVAKTMTGVCQDYSHFMIACLRSYGLACRYVSGYLETLPPPGEEKLQGVDASHAWVAIYFPRFGWLGFDPTNNILALDQHITIAWGRDYSDVPPLKGVIYSSGKHELSVEVDMLRQKSNSII